GPSDIPAVFFVLLSMLLVLISACTKSHQTGPTIYSSASSLSYAAEYSSRLQALNKKFLEASAKARTNWEQFSGFAGELTGPRWDQVKVVYEKADQAGRSEAVVEWMRQSDHVTGFIDANEGVLSQRMGAYVNAQIKKEEKPAAEDFDSRPAVRWALKDATSKVIHDRYRELNEAHRLLAAHGDSLGKKDVKTLEKQVDTITEVSFIVYVVLLDLKQQLQAKVEEGDEVKGTLDNEIKRLQLVAEAPESSKEDKAAAREGMAELLKVKAPIDADAQKSRQVLDDFEERLEQFQKQYQGTFKKLIDVVEQKRAGTIG
ncbi:MAG: hypothetical protein ABIK89_20690, partial [Planctomycetota bacterium]